MIRLTTSNDTPREPVNLVPFMREWRAGLCGLPHDYIAYHVELARIELLALESRYRFTIHNKQLVDDGWCDGMRVTQAIIETPAGRLRKIKWCDSNRAFMMACDLGGWATIDEEDLR